MESNVNLSSSLLHLTYFSWDGKHWNLTNESFKRDLNNVKNWAQICQVCNQKSILMKISVVYLTFNLIYHLSIYNQNYINISYSSCMLAIISCFNFKKNIGQSSQQRAPSNLPNYCMKEGITHGCRKEMTNK